MWWSSFSFFFRLSFESCFLRLSRLPVVSAQTSVDLRADAVGSLVCEQAACGAAFT